MKVSSSVCILAASVFGFSGLAAARTVGSGKVVSETRAVSGYHGVELTGEGELTITQGDKEGLVVEAEDNILPLVESKVNSDGTLQIALKGNDVRLTKPLRFRLSVKMLDRVALVGSGNIRAEKLSADHAHIALPGSGSIVIDHLTAGRLSVGLEGSGQIKLGGEAASQKVDLAGSGAYEAGGLKTGEATVSLSGSGECKVWAEKTLKVRLSGSGGVGYYGSPAVDKQVSGSGGVQALGAKER